MADQFQPRGCTSAAGTSWWTTAIATTSTSVSASCSADLINWPPPASSHDHSPPHSVSSTFMRSSSRVVSAPSPPPAPSALMEMDLGLGSPAIEWTQPFFTSGGGGGSSFQSLLQDDVISRPFLQDHHFLGSGINGAGGIPLLPPSSSGGLLPSSLLQGLYSSKAPQSSSGKLPAPQKQPLQFANDTPFWSPSGSGGMDGRHERPPQLVQNNEASSYSDLIVKMEKTTTSGGEPEKKKPRLGTPSPLPTFKVRKEKLGDRITALQQLVSPFGKTDTASVLHEAIEYIKFLHDQVRALSAPYSKNGHAQVQQIKSNLEKSKDIGEGGEDEDLRSRGLCLVPIPSTLAAANEIPTDFWSPTYIGSFR